MLFYLLPHILFFKDLNVAVTCVLHFLSMQERKWVQFHLFCPFFLDNRRGALHKRTMTLFESGHPVVFQRLAPEVILLLV